LLGEAAHLVKQKRTAPMRGVNQLALGVAVSLNHYRQWAILFVYAPDFGGDNIRGFVP